jgi:predicted DNA-binding transcriptional regulator AlpA
MKLIPYAALGPEKGIPYSAEWLRQMEKAGKFPKRLPGNRRLWVEPEIDSWLEAWASKREAA